MGKTAYLVLENGQVFKGEYFGAEGEVIAEVVFTTGMTGYLETLTDRSYYGQMITQTFPLIGNYGVIPEDFESSQIAARAYIVKDWCQTPSNFRSEGSLDTFLKQNNVVAIKGIDTRTLTKIIRENGTMNGMITADPEKVDFEKIKAYRVENAVRTVTTKEVYETGDLNGKWHVALLDFGLKENIVRKLASQGAKITVCPALTPVEELRKLNVDGVMLSNGPGDPAEDKEVIENVRQIMQEGIPIFGICLGHQILALAHGFKTEKLKYGHRGGNQPVKDLDTGRVYISSQNHGYAVVAESLDPQIARETFVNVNDGSNEGVEYKDCKAFSVQFHPEACGGPQDTAILFDRFFGMMEKK
ncbi:carbamoyl phosphate synthase small subunit [Scatolibacter rhodanostii]|uniref:carbamoyl phosphate synthase small subunit n=1 Tax=Scatolibacter rhodanostii TaxID=2014781 RepID=UPI000C06FDBE|nr:carbamoyl phosphate synthase small subunit [Scatolibacter rhodanostii]